MANETASRGPIYDPANAFTGRASGADLVAGRFVKVAAAKTDGNPVAVAYAGASDHSIGMICEDVKDGSVTAVYPPGHVVAVEASGTVTAGNAVEGDAGGKVKNLSSGLKRGVAMTSGGNGDFVLVQIQF